MCLRRMRRVFSFTIACLLVLGALAPRPLLAQGESAVPFLLIAPNARADGMGETGTGLSDDGAAAYWNPAGLAFQKGQEVSITHSNWLPQFQLSDLFYEYFAYKNHIEDLGGTIAASIIYLSLGEFQETHDSPEPISQFKAYEVAVTAGYATKITNDLGIGVNLRYIRSSLADFNVQGQDRKGVGSAVSFDVATMWKPTTLGDIGNRLSFGLNLSNLGPRITYIDADQADPLPTNLRLGIGAKLLKTEFNNIDFVVDFSRILVRRRPEVKDSNGIVTQKATVDDLPKSLFSAWGDGGLQKVIVSTGVEYWYGSPRLVALRFGYFYEHPQYGNRKFLTFGAGIRYNVYGFDFSYLSAVEENHPLGETLRFTLSIAWGGADQP